MRIGLIGTGLMGAPMVERAIGSGHSLIVYNRTPEKVENLRSLGAEVAISPAKAIAESDCSILMLSDARAIEETLLSPESLPVLAGHTIIQMGTISPSQSRSFKDAVNSAKGDYLEAPVLGSIPEASSGKAFRYSAPTLRTSFNVPHISPYASLSERQRRVTS